MSIGMKIKELRKKKGVARSELAEKVGLSKYAIIKYEQGQRTPKVDILVKISEALNVNFIEFLSCYDISTEFKNLSEEDERKKRSKLEEFSLKELFGERLRDLRKKRKLTQTELGKKIGKCESTIRKYEAGIVEPNIESILKIADFFNVTTDYLLGVGEFKENQMMHILDSFTSVELLEEVKKRLEKI